MNGDRLNALCGHDPLPLSALLIHYESDLVLHLDFIRRPARAVDIVEAFLRVKFEDEVLDTRLWAASVNFDRCSLISAITCASRYQMIIRSPQQDRHSVSMPFLRIRQFSGCNQGDFEPYNTTHGLKSIL